MLYLPVPPGISINKYCELVCKRANDEQQPVKFLFNDVPIHVYPGDEPDAIGRQYSDAIYERGLAREHDALLRSEERDNAIRIRDTAVSLLAVVDNKLVDAESGSTAKGALKAIRHVLADILAAGGIEVKKLPE